MNIKNKYSLCALKGLLAFILLIVVSKASVMGSVMPSELIDDKFRADIGGNSEICLVDELVFAEYTITSPSSTSEYTWILTDPTTGLDSLIFQGGARSASPILIRFSEIGAYVLTLEERLTPNATPTSTTLDIQVFPGPTVELLSDYTVCGLDYPTIYAMDPADPDLSIYQFIWSRDASGQNIVHQGTGNAGNEFSPVDEGYYFVNIFLAQTDPSNSCASLATTYVGPPVDFQFTQNTDEICGGEQVTIGLDTPISGEWWYRKQGETAKTSLGTNFSITLGRNQLTDIGTYEVGFIYSEQSDLACPSERITTVTVKEGPQVRTEDLVSPSDCGINDGSFKIYIDSDLSSLTIEELNQNYGAQSAGSEIVVTGLTTDIYTIKAVNNECTLFSYHTLNTETVTTTAPIISSDLIVECNLSDINLAPVTITFPNGNVSGNFKILSREDGTSVTGTIINESEILEELPAGSYFFEFTYADDGCTPLIQNFEIASRGQIPYTPPSLLEACEAYSLELPSNLEVNYELTTPSGDIISATQGGILSLTETGAYTLYMEPIDTNGAYCPTERNFEVIIYNNQPSFDYEIIDENCLGDQIWRAVIDNYDVDEVTFRWYNSEGRIVGRAQEFRPITFGEEYQLSVQPRHMSACFDERLLITFVQPILRVPGELSYEQECEVFSLSLTLTENAEIATWVEWNLFSEDGSVEELAAGADIFEITDDRAGTYEVIVYRDKQFGGICEITRESIDVIPPTLTPSPNLEESYVYCSKSNGVAPIDPGEYESYTWKNLDTNEIVSLNQTFIPYQDGMYELTVTTVENCTYVEEFRAYDTCNYQVVYPNAMILGDPAKDFRIVVSQQVAEVELYILNRQGELIHHAATNDIQLDSPILNWDGKSQNTYVPLGTYAIVIVLKNTEYGLEEKITGSLLILD